MVLVVNSQSGYALSPREYIKTIYRTGQVPSDDQRPQFDDESINGIVRSLEKAARSDNHHRVQTLFKTYQENVPVFATIVSDPQPAPAPTILHDNAPVAPPLEWGLLPQELGQGVSRWFDEYVAFSKKWSPRACDIQHKGAALWILSTIAARRIAASYGGLQFTPLYIALVAPSTVFAKTTTAKIATDLLAKAGLDWLLGSNSTSPEKLLSNMAGKFVPKDWEHLTAEERACETKRLAHSGQISWYYSEFGNLLKEMANDKGRNSAFKAILQRMDDGEMSYEYDTHSRGKERIENPYLALLGTMTPDCMKLYSTSDSSSWGDGFYARFAFCCPPASVKKTRATLKAERFPKNEEKAFPPGLIKPLRAWHKRLGERFCAVIPEQRGKGDVSYVIERGASPLTTYKMAPGVEAALGDYGDALAFLAQEPYMKQFQSCYGRLVDKTLRIATLIASLENSQMIELSHLAFAQHFTEELRMSLHQLDIFLKQNNIASERARLEDEIIQYVAEADTYLTSRLMRRRKFKNQDAAAFDSILDSLEKSGELVRMMGRRGKFYTVPGKEKRPLPQIHASGGAE
jgi:hypothetical protein